MAQELVGRCCQIYVLFLGNGCLYVRKKYSFHDRRLRQHQGIVDSKGRTAAWVEENKHLSTLCVIKECTASDKDLVTLLLMKVFGIQFVRGGSFVTRILEDKIEMSLRSIFWSSQLTWDVNIFIFRVIAGYTVIVTPGQVTSEQILQDYTFGELTIERTNGSFREAYRSISMLLLEISNQFEFLEVDLFHIEGIVVPSVEFF